MHWVMILLSILKVIGWILLILLGIILLILILVLVVPIRYSFEVDKPEEMEVRVNIKGSWFPYLLKMNLAAVNTKVRYRLKVAWFTLADSEKDEDDKTKKNKKSTHEKLPESAKDSDPEKLPEEVKDDVPDLPKEETDAESEEKPEEAESVEVESVEAESGEEESEKGESDGEDSGGEPKEEGEPQEKLPVKRVYRIRSAIEAFMDKVAFVIVKICGFLADPGGAVAGLSEGLTDRMGSLNEIREKLKGHPVKTYLKIGLKIIKKLLRHVRPRKLTGYLMYSMEDGYYTGKIAGYAAVLYPLYGKNLSIIPRFDIDETMIKGHLKGSGYVRLGYLLYLVLLLLWIKETRRLIFMALKGEL